ncbi:hypothetical protein SH668x_000553 [Planctomicrobium sp. SH668]|uniref:hypothetical protein n=1 Tax=Planctomicrobium sp. SH668 TaxID=3448126 RepID=UPI003F5B062A
MPLGELQRLLQSIEPAAHLVEPRVLRRVVRLDRRLQGIRFAIPHDFSYTIDRDRLLAFAELNELNVDPEIDLPRRVILLSQPDEEDLLDQSLWPKIRKRYLSYLFHSCVHLAFDRQLARISADEEWSIERIAKIGPVEFCEIREVLQRENLLFQPINEVDTYVEFASVALEQKYFAPHLRPIYFPGVRDWDFVDQSLSTDIDHQQLFERFHPILDEIAAESSSTTSQTSPTESFHRLTSTNVSVPAFRVLMAKAESKAATGNGVKASLSYLRTARRAPIGYEQEALDAAELELARFAQRLQRVFSLSAEEAEHWRDALRPLLAPAAEGFWSNEARLLYDLQKVCAEQERGIYRLDLVEWVRSFGKRPIRRPLPLMQDVLTLRHLRTVQRRLGTASITPAEKSKLSRLLEGVLPRVEHRSRDRMRGIIENVFDEVGFVARNILETVARRKIVEELLDRIVERSYFNLGDLRDSISKNDMKLNDVTSLKELAFGDCMLQADRKLETALDGIYRRGTIYLRWPQTLSSLVFGTNVGRLLTQHVFIPFGGAYLILEFLHHLKAMIVGHPEGQDPHHFIVDDPLHTELEIAPHPVEVPHINDVVEQVSSGPDLALWTGVLVLGIWISLLIQRSDFRAWNVAVLSRAWSFLRGLVLDLPSFLLNSEYVQRIFGSRTFAVLRSYVLEPVLFVCLLTPLSLLWGDNIWSFRTAMEVLLVIALLWNSPAGRYASEMAIDFLVRAWQELKMHIFAAVVQWILDAFEWLMISLERVVYTVDEWLRFRTSDNTITRGIKLAMGVVWFFVSYVIVFIFTLLVEPQINPIKHFPVVTVSHKLILPAFPVFVTQLTPYLGRKMAQSVVGITIFLIPGVFGFLVWELKENWRLYGANRRRTLGPEAIGSHGETMLRLLRPGFHSGTLPKAYTKLRRLTRKRAAIDESQIQRKRAGILHIEEAIHHFVERELLNLLEEARFLPETRLIVSSVYAATNRIEAEVTRIDRLNHPAKLIWELVDGQLLGSIQPAGWMLDLDAENQAILRAGLEALMTLSGVNTVIGEFPVCVDHPIAWTNAVEYWTNILQINQSQPISRTDVSQIPHN